MHLLLGPLTVGLASILSVEVSSEVPCPGAAEIDARVRPLLPSAGDGSTRPHTVHVARGADGGLVITLLDGVIPLVVRTLRAGGSCEQLADSVAALVASWETQLAASVAAMPTEIRTANAEPPSQPVTAALRFGGGMALSPGTPMVPTAFGELAFGRRDRSLGLVLGARFEGEVVQPLGPGQVAWNRTGAHLAATFHRSGSIVSSEVQLAAVGALLRIRGRGFAEDTTAIRFSPGVTLDGRVGLRTGRVSPWLSAALDLWPFQTEARLRDAYSTQALPTAAIRFSLGLTISLMK